MYQSLFLYPCLIATKTKETPSIFDARAIIESASFVNKVYLQKDLRGSLYCELDKKIKEKS